MAPCLPAVRRSTRAPAATRAGQFLGLVCALIPLVGFGNSNSR
jgi:hypothetical protein